MQCRIQNETPVTGSRLLFNKLKNRIFAHGIIVNKKIKGEQMTFEWKHPNYYKELKKIYEEEFKDQPSEEKEDQSPPDTEDSQK